MSRTFQRLVTLGTALLVSLALALPALAAEPGNNENTSSQTAANTAYVTITAVAVSGDATGKDGGKAESGDATVFIASEQEQLNAQAVVSGVVGNCGCEEQKDSNHQQTCGCPASAKDNATQTADNYAQATLEGTANSGDAKAVGEKEEHGDLSATSVPGYREKNAEAESGDATVKIISEQEQANLQLALNLAIPKIEKHDEHGDAATTAPETEKKGATAENTSTQTAANTARANLTGAAWSGDANAEGKHAEAESGEAEVFIFSEQEQLNAQAIVNLAFPFSSKNKADQKAVGNYAQAGVDGTAWSGDAKADQSKDVQSGEAEVIVPNEQEQASLQLVVTFNGVKVKCY